MFSAVFFDFDGVIIDSADIKTDAFHELFLGFGKEKATLVREYHLQNQGISRFKKFEYFFKNIIMLPYSDDVGHDYSNKFSKIVFQKIIESSFIPGVLAFLEALKRKNRKAFLLSATPEEELREICLSKNIDRYFSRILGSPKNKVEHGKEILSDFNYTPEQVLFFGDNISDFQASQTLGTQFIGVGKEGKHLFSRDVFIIEDFKNIVNLK